ncbi:MAG TPA: ABC transporter permease [Blastocatellia bacterium]
MPSRLKIALRALLRRAQTERELDEELRYHIEQQIEQNIRLGMNLEEARTAARKAFGGVEQAKERSRDARGVRWLEDIWQDLRFGARMLAKNPGHTLAIILILALGAGANTAIFTVVDAWLVRPLPFKEPERLVAIWKSELKNPRVPSIFAFQREYQEWIEHSKSFESLAGFYLQSYTLSGQGEPEDLLGQIVTQNLFSTLGVSAARGRVFLPEDMNGPLVVMLSHELWQRRFGGAPDAIGKTLSLNDKSYTVIGVMPPKFTLPSIFQPNRLDIIWTLMRPDAEPLWGNPLRNMAVIGRLHPGVTAPRAEADLAGLQQLIDQKYPPAPDARGYGVIATNMQEDVTRDMRPTLLTMFGAVIFTLLIAFANVASLLLGRVTERLKEMAVRSALGAGRLRLARQLLTESVFLSLIGAACGLLLAQVGLRYFLALDPFEKLPFNEIALNSRVLTFTALLTILTGVLFGAIPALQASRLNINELLKESGRGSSSGAGSRRARNLLVIVETALSLMLLIGAGLMIKSFARLTSEPRGFNAENVLTLRVAIPKQGYSEAKKLNDLYDRLLERLRGLPGVQATGTTSQIPIYIGGGYQMSIEGDAVTTPEGVVYSYFVSPDYLAAVSIPVVKGRRFDRRDREDAEKVAIVNEELARRFFPDQDPLGTRIRIGAFNPQANPQTGSQSSDQPAWLRIVGVAGNTKYNLYGYLGWRVSPMVYLPRRQAPDEAGAGVGRNGYVVIRAANNPTQLISSVRAEIQSLDSNLQLPDIKPLEDDLFRETLQHRLRTAALGGFAGLALLLAAIGIYGVLSQSILQRRHEIGIRMALGAETGDILRLVTRQGMTPVLIGSLIGLIAAYWLARLLSGMLYGVGVNDPAIFVIVPLLLGAVALLACYLPARKAAKVDPLISLRHE